MSKTMQLTPKQYAALCHDLPTREATSLHRKFPKKNKPPKYGNTKTEYDGLKFDSIKERDRYLQLLEKIKYGGVSCLQRQVEFELVPKTDRFKAITYVADFTYKDRFGSLIVEDVKPWDKKKRKYYLTKEYLIKKKLMYRVHKILVKEI